jgi:threonine dehydratase
MSVQARDLADAAARLSGVAHRTPLFRSRTLDQRLGAKLVFKGEHLQCAGAFKFRGAYVALSRLGEERRRRGVVTWSSGNHAAGLALAGRLLGVPVTVAMPVDAIPLKRAAAEGYGATIVECEASQREVVGKALAEEHGLTIIPPYDHPAIIAGQGTAAAELLEDSPGLDLLLAPIGGGGLLAGSALAAAAHPGVEVVGVEPAQADDVARSMAEGHIVVLENTPRTLADGLRTRFVGERNFEILQQHGVRIVTVEEEAIVEALRYLWIRMKQLVEPSAAVPLAALLSGRLDVEGRRVGIILSGGNCDPAAIARLL